MTANQARQGVTVVVPTLNRGTYLLDTVADLLAQEHRPLEILIVDQSDTIDPALDHLVAAHPEIVSHHRVDFRGLPLARNYGWQVARHDLIVYVDDDIRCGSTFIGSYHDRLQTQEWGIVGGGVDGESPGTRCRAGRYNRWTAMPSPCFAAEIADEVDHVKGCNFGVQRAVAAHLGGFDERLNVGAALHEETELMLRARANGIRILYDGKVRLMHLAASGGGTRQRDIGTYVEALAHNRSVLIRRHSHRYQWPTALAYTFKLIAAYTMHYRQWQTPFKGLRGLVAGWRAGGEPPVCSAVCPDATS